MWWIFVAICTAVGGGVALALAFALVTDPQSRMGAVAGAVAGGMALGAGIGLAIYYAVRDIEDAAKEAAKDAGKEAGKEAVDEGIIQAKNNGQDMAVTALEHAKQHGPDLMKHIPKPALALAKDISFPF